MSKPKATVLTFDPAILLASQTAVSAGIAIAGAGFVVAAASYKLASAAYKEVSERAKEAHKAAQIDAVKEEIEQEKAQISLLLNAASDISTEVTPPELNFSGAERLEDYESFILSLRKRKEQLKENIRTSYRKKVLQKGAGLKTLLELSTDSIAAIPDGALMAEALLWTADTLPKNSLKSVYLKQATQLFEAFKNQFPNRLLSKDLIQKVAKIEAAANNSAASIAFEQLKVALKSETKQAEAAIRQAEKARRKEEAEKIHRIIGLHIHNALEEMGYAASGIEESCYVRNGEIYAQFPQFPGYAARLSVDPESSRQLKAEAVRFASSADSANREKRDEEFESFWCSKPQLGQLVQKLKNAGIGTDFRVIDPKAKRVVEVDSSNIPESSRVTIASERKAPKRVKKSPRKRERKPGA